MVCQTPSNGTMSTYTQLTMLSRHLSVIGGVVTEVLEQPGQEDLSPLLAPEYA